MLTMAAKENWLGSKRRRTNHDIRDFILVHGKILRESVAAEVPLSTRTKRSEAEDEDDFHPPARTLGLLGSAMAAGSGRRVKQSAISVRAGGDCSGQSTSERVHVIQPLCPPPPPPPPPYSYVTGTFALSLRASTGLHL